jgi:hypothetical protein
MSITAMGNTYPARQALKAAGFKWAPRYKEWIHNGTLSDDQINALAAFNGLRLESVADSGKNETLLDNRSHKQRYGRCEDAPCCGCCGNSGY